MKKFLLKGFTVAGLLSLAAPAMADNWVIDFDTDSNGNTLAARSIFSNPGAFYNPTSSSGTANQRYLSGIPGSSGVGVHISALHGSYDGHTYAVGYDSSGGNNISGTNYGNDDDLEENFAVKTSSSFGTIPGESTSRVAASGVAASGYDNILIIQEMSSSPYGCGSTSGGICEKADDERDGGVLKFDFDEAVDLVGMNIFDIEEDHGDQWYMGKVWFYYEDDSYAYLDIPVIGDSSVAFMNFGDFGQDVISMRVKCAGSCAIDNITGDAGDDDTPGVPEPGAMALFGIGMAGVALARRRRRIAA